MSASDDALPEPSGGGGGATVPRLDLSSHSVDGLPSAAPHRPARLQPPEPQRLRPGTMSCDAPEFASGSAPFHGAGPWSMRPNEDASPASSDTRSRQVRGGRFGGDAAATLAKAKGGPAAPAGAHPGVSPGSGRIKLVLHYAQGENPMSELLRLGGGQGVDVIVEAVSEQGKAARAGVKPGFALVSINGGSEFVQLPGWQVRLLLDNAPITLGFDPDPVKPQSAKCTEIRLARAQEVLGIPPRGAVCGPLDRSFLAETVVFKPGCAPLWLSARSDEAARAFPEPFARAPPRRVYELRRPEASALVGRAVRGARALSPNLEDRDAKWAAAAAAARRAAAPRWRAPLCAADCVAECIGDGDDDEAEMWAIGGAVAPCGLAQAVPALPPRRLGPPDGHPVVGASGLSARRRGGEQRLRSVFDGADAAGAAASPIGPRAGAVAAAGAFACGAGRAAPGSGAAPPRAAAPRSGGLFAGDDGAACDVDDGPASPAAPASPASPRTPEMRSPVELWVGGEVRLSDIYASEVGACEI